MKNKEHEDLKQQHQEDVAYEEATPRDRPSHYSRKGGHPHRSEANDPRKRSKRRRGGRRS